MNRTIINKVLKAGLITFGLIAVITGVIKFGGLHGNLNFLLAYLPTWLLYSAHDWSGFTAVVLALVLILSRWLMPKSSAAEAPARKVFGVRLSFWALLGLALLGAIMFALNYLRRPAASEEVKRLAAVEVREYQGEKLSSVADLPDNSIKGPQYVDKNTYRLEITGLVDSPQKLTYDEVLNRQK